MANEILWTVPRLWPDGECFILGGGPSLKQDHVDLLEGRRVIVVNNAYLMAPWADVLFFGDCRWYEYSPNGGQAHKTRLAKFGGLIITSCENLKNKPGIHAVKKRNSPFGVHKQAYFLSWNLSSGACAISLAVHLGVKRIVLLGFDMRKVDGRCNWHKDHPTSSNVKHNPYERFLKPFPMIARDLNKLGVECINATPESALTEFPIARLEDVL